MRVLNTGSEKIGATKINTQLQKNTCKALF